MAVDSGIVTIYDLENNGSPLQCHRIDAKEFLANPRWSTSPGEKKQGDAKPLETKDDNGTAMQLKSMDFKALRAMASKTGIADYIKMDKAALVEALEAGK
jgi:hypothetical protein